MNFRRLYRKVCRLWLCRWRLRSRSFLVELFFEMLQTWRILACVLELVVDPDARTAVVSVKGPVDLPVLQGVNLRLPLCCPGFFCLFPSM